MSNLGERIAERLRSLDMSQSELARRVGIKQPSISYLIKTGAAGSAHIHRLAQALQTTPAYLAGETDDPSTDAIPVITVNPQRVDVDFISEIAKSIEVACLYLDIRLPSTQLLRQTMTIYNNIITVCKTAKQRDVGLQMEIQRFRQELEASPPTEQPSKRSA